MPESLVGLVPRQPRRPEGRRHRRGPGAGPGIAEQLAREGAQVTIADIQLDKARAARKTCASAA